MFRIKLFVLGLLSVSVMGAADAWISEYLQPFTFSCKEGEVISRVISDHSGKPNEDRRFQFTCSEAPEKATLTGCEWSDYVYDFNGILHYQCPESGIITGAHSVYEYDKKDRRFSLRCCFPSGYVLHGCESRWVNDFDQKLDYTVGDDYVIKGWTSIFEERSRDRRYAMLACKLGRVKSDC